MSEEAKCQIMKNPFRYRWAMVYRPAPDSPVLLGERRISFFTKQGAKRAIWNDAMRDPARCGIDGYFAYGDPSKPVEWGYRTVERILT